MSAIFRALWAYRGFILGSVKREFQSKYRNSLLGAAWTVLNPLAMIVVYTVIFAEVSNLFDETYASSTLVLDQASPLQAAFIPGTGRAFTLGAKLKF